MGSKENRQRKKWQEDSGIKALNAEKNFYEAFVLFFENTEFMIRKKPNELNKIYLNIPLSSKEQSEIFTPDEPIKRHGVVPDYAIDNKETNKTIYVEVKRQDGWVEGGKRSDGRGNAHERSCKYFTPGLLNIMRRKGNIEKNHLPFWTVFQGDITRDPCRVREITCWYDKYKHNFFFWRDPRNMELLFEHFDNYIKPILS